MARSANSATSRPRRPAGRYPCDVPRGRRGDGVDGLRAYLDAQRQREFVDNLCRKLLAYALGRSLLPSDDDTSNRCARGWRPTAIASAAWSRSIVTSPQFLNRRVDSELAEK